MLSGSESRPGVGGRRPAQPGTSAVIASANPALAGAYERRIIGRRSAQAAEFIARIASAQKNPTRDPSTNVGKPDKNGDPAKPEKGPKPIETDEPPSPGAGHLPPVPDGADLPPLTAEDAARHLELASQRIEEDYKAYRRAKAPAPAANVRDW